MQFDRYRSENNKMAWNRNNIFIIMRVRHVLHQHKHFIKYSDQYYCTVSDYGQGDLIAIIFLDEGVISKTFSLRIHLQELEETVLWKRVEGLSKTFLLHSLGESSGALGCKDIFILGKNKRRRSLFWLSFCLNHLFYWRKKSFHFSPFSIFVGK